MPLTRRTFCKLLGQSAGVAALPVPFTHSAPAIPKGMSLSIGNYGMQSFKVEQAIRLVAAIGFDGLELAMMPDWDSAPAKSSSERRGMLQRMLKDRDLQLTALMEDLVPSAEEATHQQTLDRLKQAAEFGHDVYPQHPPLIETTLGGGTWEEKKNLFRDRLGDWLRTAESTKTVIAIKPHRRGAMSRPTEAAWLRAQLGDSPWLGMVYDYSHYALREMPIADTIKAAWPMTVHIAVKDLVAKGNEVEFALPGEAKTIDYSEILTQFYELGYRNDVCCEVSSQVFRRSGYDAAQAAKESYSNMNMAFDAAHVPRRRPQ